MREALVCFGPQRVIQGGDWPVSGLRGDYAGRQAMAQCLVAELAAGGEAAVFGDTARRVYRLTD